MLELLIIYKWSLLAGAIAAGALAFLGAQTAARDKSMQTLCVGQGAMFGVLLGVGIAGGHSGASEWEVHFLPFILSVLISLLIGSMGLFIEKQQKASKNTYFIAIFAFLLALNHLISALFPSLESHMAQVFFGDLATISEKDVWIALFFSLGIMVLQWFNWRATSNLSFESAIFGNTRFNFFNLNLQSKINEFSSFLFVCFSIQFLGFLFTITCLFLPTIMMSLKVRKGLLSHLISVSVIAGVGCVLGFLTSLNFNLPTVPTITVVIALVAMINFLPNKKNCFSEQ